jgi:SAM-dependent methyltransferase
LFKNHTKCRVCNSERLVPYLDLQDMPLSNSLANTREEALLSKQFPLKVLFCEDCFLSQLSIVIDPEVMFSNYVYRSSINKGYVEHARRMAKDLKEKYRLNQASFMIDIAGNDCALLKEFQQEIGLRVLNVDPAKNLIKICLDDDIPAVSKFWSKQTAVEILANEGRADLITATNVFAHCDDVRGFIEAAKYLLTPRGVLVLEFPYLVDFIEKVEFDTIYFEHLSYFSITPLFHLCQKCGMNIIEVEKQEIHGGSVRVTIGHDEPKESVYQYLEFEKDYSKKEVYLDWAKRVKESAWKFKNGLAGLFLNKYKIAGFAASAKGNTLLNFTSANHSIIRYIIDQTPEKIGKFSPGTGIEIVNMDRLKEDPPDYLIILSWNFLSEIIDKCIKYGYRGKFICPIPEFKIIENGIDYLQQERQGVHRAA